MDYSKNRREFYKEFPSLINEIVCDEQFIEKLGKYKFGVFEKPLKELETSREKSILVLLEMSKERRMCKRLIQLLRDCNQVEIAHTLEQYNTPLPLDLFDFEIEIPVTETIHEKERTNCFALSNSPDPNSLCIIVNNVENPQRPEDNHGLVAETKRFAHIFGKLRFKVEILRLLNNNRLIEELSMLKHKYDLYKFEAIVLIVISHGQDESIFGYDACEAIRTANFIPKYQTDQDYGEKLKTDFISIKTLVSIFAEYKTIPKMYFFICCRINPPNSLNNSEPMDTDEEDQIVTNWLEYPLEPDSLDKKNIDTFISYSCARGFSTYYNPNWGMTYFGQALTQVIAKKAADRHLTEIMNDTTDCLNQIYDYLKDLARKEGKDPIYLFGPGFPIELRTYRMHQSVFFNP